MRRAAKPADRPAFPEVRERIGEDPARYLSDQTSFDPAPRIRGIDDRETAAAWLAIARRLGCSPHIQQALEDRLDALRPSAVAAQGGERADV